MTGNTDGALFGRRSPHEPGNGRSSPGMTDEQLVAEAGQISPAVQAWLATLSDDDLMEITDDTAAGRALLTTAPVGAG